MKCTVPEPHVISCVSSWLLVGEENLYLVPCELKINFADSQSLGSESDLISTPSVANPLEKERFLQPSGCVIGFFVLRSCSTEGGGPQACPGHLDCVHLRLLKADATSRCYSHSKDLHSIHLCCRPGKMLTLAFSSWKLGKWCTVRNLSNGMQLSSLEVCIHRRMMPTEHNKTTC